MLFPNFKQAQVKRKKESKLTIRGDKNQGLVSIKEV